MKTLILLMLLALPLTGCTTAKRFVDVDATARSQEVRIVKVEGRNLHLHVAQNLAPAYLADVKARVMENRVYLYPIRISSVVHQTEFDVSLAGLDLPSEWRERIYWVDGETYSNPLNPFTERFHQIEQRHLMVEK